MGTDVVMHRLHSFVGTDVANVVGHYIVMWSLTLSSALMIKLFVEQHPLSRNGEMCSKDGVWVPMWQSNKIKKGYTHHPFTLWNAFASVQLHTQGDSQGTLQ